jgi:CRISP-associated protein Cas1
MKKHLNTIFITSDDAYIRKERETFVVEMNNKKMLQAPIHSIENIVCFGFKPISPALMAFCAGNNVGVSYLSPEGRFLARVYGEQKGNVLLRKAQYEIADSVAGSLAIARPIIAAKISNFRNILLRHDRNHPDASDPTVGEAAKLMEQSLTKIKGAESLDELRGIEGECAKYYFSVMSFLITSQKDDFTFTQRSRRPPLDRSNALLSFLYAVLANDVRSALETTGLDPQVGFLHQMRSGRPSLALDLMEEFRAYMADRVMLSLINLKQVQKDDFEIRESGEVRMKDETRKVIITAYQKRKQEEIEHPYLGERMTIGLLPHIQALLLARFIRGDIDAYPPFYIK